MIFYLLGILGYYKAIKKAVPAGICLAFFLTVIIPPGISLFFLLNVHWIFQVITFISGWLCWTFIEYFSHRFRLRRKTNKNDHGTHHFIHHTNPTKIFTTEIKRLFITAVALSTFYFSINYSVYLFFPAGILCGYALYGYIHIWLHRLHMPHLFKKLQEFHIQHHCGDTENSFGVTVTWWDKIFNTAPAAGKIINIKKEEFYFGETKTPAIIQPLNY